MGINQWVGASISLYKVILAIFHQSSAYYLRKLQTFKKSKKLLISSLKLRSHRCYLSSLWCSVKSTSFLAIFETFKSRIHALSKIGNVLLFFYCISKNFFISAQLT